MKKLVFSLFTVLILQIPLSAQTDKRIVIEHFTNTHCSTCAARNPGLYNNINQHPEVLHLSYHPSAPYPACVLNKHNKAENDGRTNYYSIYGSTPRIVIQGNVISPSTNYNDAAIFTQHTGEMSTYAVKLSLLPTPAESFTLKVTVTHKGGTSADSAKLFAGVFEDTVFYNAPNGEVNPKNVFRKSFTDIDGAWIQLPQANGDSLEYTFSVNQDFEWEAEAIYAAALLQDADGKLIQAGSSRDANGSNPLTIQRAAASTLKIYPNPTYHSIQLPIARGSSYTVYDPQGRLVLKGSYENTLSLETLKPGVYSIKAWDGNEVKQGTVVKRP